MWSNPSEARLLSDEKCKLCAGIGMKHGRPCWCVLRKMFRVCYRQFERCASVSPEYRCTYNGRGHWHRQNDEYVADFLLIAKRTLTDEEHRIFRYHFLLGADWKLCCRKLSLDKGRYFHALYRIERKLGQAFRELKPYSLYPPWRYFGAAAA